MEQAAAVYRTEKWERMDLQEWTGTSDPLRFCKLNREAYWQRVLAEPGVPVAEWAKYRLEVGQYFYRLTGQTFGIERTFYNWPWVNLRRC